MSTIAPKVVPKIVPKIVPKEGALAGWVRIHPGTVDVVLVALVLAAFEMPAFDPYRHHGGTWWPFWGLAVAVPLVWRRRIPVAALWVSLAGTAGALLTRSGPDWGALSLVVLLLGPAVALATAASIVPTDLAERLALLSAGAVVVIMLLARHLILDVLTAQLAVLTAAWLTGEAIKARRGEIALLRERIKRESEQAVDDERTRIARELHDMVAHQLSVIAVQAGATRLAAGEDSQLNPGLVAIEEASRQALTDLRRALGVLRRDDHVGGVAPQPGLDQLEPLAARLRDAGLALRLTVAGPITVVPDGISVSVYRIVQEALTNVLKHAGPVNTEVRVDCSRSCVMVEVRNNASGLAGGDGAHVGPDLGRDVGPDVGDVGPDLGSDFGSVGGHGLIGMRERVAAYNGSMEAGPLPTGGFAVVVRIPLVA